MPNIELHGYEDRSETVRLKIAEALKDLPHNETATTVFPSVVTTLDGNKSPYLRIVSDLESIGHLVKLLEPVGEDIEVIPLGQWVPKKQ